MKILFGLSLTIFLASSLYAQDIPGFMFYPYKVNIININNNILMQSYDEFVFFDMSKKKVNSRIYFDPLYNNQFYTDLDNFIIRDNDLVYSDGTIINIVNWQYKRIVDDFRFSKIKPYGKEEYVGLFENYLYKLRDDVSSEEKLYTINNTLNDYFASEEVIILIDSDYNLRRNNSDEVIKTNLNNSKFKELRDFIIIYNSEELYIYNKKKNSVFKFNSNISLFSANNNYIYTLVESSVYRVDLYNNYEVEEIDLNGNSVYAMTEVEDGLLILNSLAQLIKINEKDEFVSEVNYGSPIKAKLIENKLVVISFAVNSFWLKVYNENNELEYDRWFDYDLNQNEKLPFHMDDQGVYFIEEKNGSTKLVSFSISDYSIKEYLLDSDERVKIVNRIGNNLFYLTFDSTLNSVNILTDKIEFKKKLDFEIDFIKLIDENEFWYLSRVRREDYELGTYNITTNQRMKKLPETLEVHETNYDFPIFIDNNSEYIISATSSDIYIYSLQQAKSFRFLANLENDRPFPLMPYYIDENSFIIFYENGDIMRHDYTQTSENRVFSDEIKTFTLRKDFSILKDDFYRLNVSDFDLENSKMIYNTNGSIIRKDYTISSLSLDNLVNQPKFVSYPQPANTCVTIEFESQKYNIGKQDITIYNIEGRELKNQEITINNNSLTWNCSAVQPGIYLISIKHGSEEKTIKVVVE